MKKILLFFMLLFIPFFVDAAINSNYSTSKKYTDTYITKFDSYRLYVERTTNAYQVPFDYRGHNNLEVISGFELGGFLSLFEYNTSKHNGSTYLSTGQEYWTLTSNSATQNYYISRTDPALKNISDKTGVRITEQIIPQTKVTGNGTYNDPWVFIKPEFNITLNLVNAKVEGTTSYNKTIYQYDITYDIVPDADYYIYDTHECTGNTNVSYDDVNHKLVLDNILSNVTCTIKYKKKSYSVTINANNADVGTPNQSVVHGENAVTLIAPESQYAYKTASCTNGQSFSYLSSDSKFTVSNVTNNTVCTIQYDKVPDKNIPYTEGDVTYPIEYTGYYFLTGYGARGAGNGGKGAYAESVVYLTKGQTLVINTGGTNGYNGGGTGYYRGGGSTTFKRDGTLLMAAAGGGGGAAGTDGGSGTGAGGAKPDTNGSGTNGGAGGAGSNGAGGGASYDYTYNIANPCKTGSNTCAGGYVQTNCSSCHHREYECQGDWVETSTCERWGTCSTNYGTGYGYYKCSNGSWYWQSSTYNVSCSGGCSKDYTCDGGPSGSCTNGDTATETCTGWCDCSCCDRYKEVWDSCAYESRVCVYDCDTVWSDCATGANTCVAGYDSGTKSYNSGKGGSNYFNASFVSGDSTMSGANTGNGSAAIKFFGETK